MPTDNNEARSDAQAIDLTEALALVARGECPDGGGPHCVCKLTGKKAQCVSLRTLPKCRLCDDDGVFRLGQFSDTCGECFGTKYIDGDYWEADMLAWCRRKGYDAYIDGKVAAGPVGLDEPAHVMAWNDGLAAAITADALGEEANS